MKLLFISHAFPLPANNGQKMRAWSFLRALAAEGHQLTLVTFSHTAEINGTMAALHEVCAHIEIVPQALTNLSDSAGHFDRLLGLLSATPYTTKRFVSSEMRQTIQRLLESHRFSAVVCDFFSLVNIPQTSIPIVLNTQNVEHLVLLRYLPFEKNPLKRLYAWLEATKIRRAEESACRRAAIGMACSAVDCQLLQALAPGVPFTVAPNTVDTENYTPIEEEQATIVYQGGMDWFPNRDAVEYFVFQMLPHLRRRVPGVRFVAAGRNPSPEFLDHFKGLADVEFTGTVSDMRPVVARAAVCVVPLRIGSGTRLKILEAAGMGKAVVATSLGAEGLEFEDGKEIMLADDPESFAEIVAGLLADPARRREMGRAARRKVEQKYSFAELRHSLRQALEQFQVGSSMETVGAAQ